MKTVSQVQARTVESLVMAVLSGKLDLSPEYQRPSVWTEKMKQSLIGSVFSGFPIPSVSIRGLEQQEGSNKREEMIDGKQRVSTLVDFYNNKFKYFDLLYRTDLNGRFFKDLSGKDKQQFEETVLAVTLINMAEADVIELFVRVNTGHKRASREMVFKANVSNTTSYSVLKDKITNDYALLKQGRLNNDQALYAIYQALAETIMKGQEDYRSSPSANADAFVFKIKKDQSAERDFLHRSEVLLKLMKRGNILIPQKHYFYAPVIATALLDAAANDIPKAISIWNDDAFTELRKAFDHLLKTRDLSLIEFATEKALELPKETLAKRGANEQVRKHVYEAVRALAGKLAASPEKKRLFKIKPSAEASCAFCGATDHLEVDHIVPFSKGGRTKVDNAQVLCKSCNTSKGNKSLA